MSDHILYNFEANNSHLDDIHGHMQDIDSIKEDISHIFTTLGQHYEGQGSESLLAAHGQIHSALDEHLNTMMTTHRQAGEQQETMQALDRAHAADFG
jgi:uncharacterized protein YukE